MDRDILINKAKNIYRELGLEKLLKSGQVMKRLDYSNCYTYYKSCRDTRLPGTRNKPPDFAAAFNNCSSCSIYVSVPFCASSCAFCQNRQTYYKNMAAVKAKYTDYLNRELRLLETYIDVKSVDVKYIYFGGGTPTFLDQEQLIGITDNIRNSFRTGDDLYIAAESNPATLRGNEGRRKLDALKSAGFNKISLGFQDTDDDVLRITGRTHSAGDNFETFNSVRAAGFDTINIDLMYGLPGQTLHSWYSTLEKTILLKPDSMEIFRLRFDGGYNRIYRMLIRNPKLFPTLRENFIMKIMAKEMLENAGYEELFPGMFFSRLTPNPYSRYIPYFTESDSRNIIVLGSDGRGQSKDLYYSNHSGYAYLDMLDDNRLPICGTDILTGRRKMENYMIAALLNTTTGIDADKFKDKFGKELSCEFSQVLAELSRWGLLTADTPFKLTYKGSLFADDVFRILMDERWHHRIMRLFFRPQLKRALLRIRNMDKAKLINQISATS